MEIQNLEGQNQPKKSILSSIGRIILAVVLVVADLVAAVFIYFASCGGELTLCETSSLVPIAGFIILLVIEIIIWKVISKVLSKK